MEERTSQVEGKDADAGQGEDEDCGDFGKMEAEGGAAPGPDGRGDKAQPRQASQASLRPDLIIRE